MNEVISINYRVYGFFCARDEHGEPIMYAIVLSAIAFACAVCAYAFLSTHATTHV